MLQKIINNRLKDSWLFILIFYPKIYLFTILKHAILMGIFTFGLSYFYFYGEYSNIKIPTTTHALISVAIGLLLVFRTQSAYERWTTASQNFYMHFIRFWNWCLFYSNTRRSILHNFIDYSIQCVHI